MNNRPKSLVIIHEENEEVEDPNEVMNDTICRMCWGAHPNGHWDG